MDIIWHDEDGLVLGEPQDIVVEVKSIAQFPFHSSRNKQRDFTWYGAEDIPKTDHYTQTQMYMWGEKKEYGIIHYYSKNDGQEKVWLVNIDYDYLAELFARLESVYLAVVANELPDRPYEAYPSRDNTRLLKGTKINNVYHKSYWRCLYCGYASKCWKLKGYEDKEE
jgi:CRISPR/Cas system-associated exonuclease Cas4 (RecB family)